MVEELARAAADPSTHQYPSYFGLPSFRRAIADFYRRRFGVELDPDTQVLPLIGSKEGIAHLPWAFVDPGDQVLVTEPGYPVYEVGTILAGGEPVHIPLTAEGGWFPDFAAVDPSTAPGAKLLWLCYPSNPTGAVATVDQLADAVRFAAERDLLLAYDNAYSEITYDGFVAPSVLQVPGATEVALEFGSLSKIFNMTGWRIGWAVGSPVAIEALGRVKTNIDSGIFNAVQRAGVAALESGMPHLPGLLETYRRRRDRIMEVFWDAGWKVEAPKGALYVWLPTPPGSRASTSPPGCWTRPAWSWPPAPATARAARATSACPSPSPTAASKRAASGSARRWSAGRRTKAGGKWRDGSRATRYGGRDD